MKYVTFFGTLGRISKMLPYFDWCSFQAIPGCEVTMGQESEDGGRWPFAGATGAVKAMGSIHVPKEVSVSFLAYNGMTEWAKNFLNVGELLKYRMYTDGKF